MNGRYQGIFAIHFISGHSSPEPVEKGVIGKSFSSVFTVSVQGFGSEKPVVPIGLEFSWCPRSARGQGP